MINIQDKLFVEIKIDGQALGGVNLVASIALLEGAPVVAPSLVMILNDHSHNLTERLCLTDGNEILVTVGKSPDDLKSVTRQYRLFGVHAISGQSGPCIRILGIYDAPKYITESTTTSFEGTTCAVVKQVADRCSLDYDGPEDFNGRATADSQIWLVATKTLGAFVQHDLARHAYMDAHSAMYACLTSLGVLKYRNVMDVVGKPFDEIKYVFVHNALVGDQDVKRQVYIVAQARERSQAGLMNTMHNYGSSLVVDGPSGAQQVETKVDVKTSAPYLAINDQVSQTVTKTRVAYGPLDCGNVYDNYYKAGYQNVKQLALFSERQSLLVTEPTEVQLLDTVIYKQADADSAKTVKSSDVYVVIGKTLFVAGRNYMERIELARMSLTEEGEASLKSSEPTTARESSLPEITIDPSATVAANSVPKVNSIMAVMGPIESAGTSCRNTASRLVNSVKLSQPSLIRMSGNIHGYATNAAQAASDIRSSAASVRQMKQAASDMKASIKTVVDGARSGNLQMAASGLSNVTRSAAMFRPGGYVSSLCSTFGPIQSMRSVSEAYKTVADSLQSSRSALDAASGIGSELDGVTSDMYSVVDDYNSIMGSAGQGYNALIETVSGKTPNYNTPNLETNRYFFQERIRESVAPVSGALSSVQYSVPSVADVQHNVATSLNTTDDTRNYGWVPESGYTTIAVPVSELAKTVKEIGDNASAADIQMNEYIGSLA